MCSLINASFADKIRIFLLVNRLNYRLSMWCYLKIIDGLLTIFLFEIFPMNRSSFEGVDFLNFSMLFKMIKIGVFIFIFEWLSFFKFILLFISGHNEFDNKRR